MATIIGINSAGGQYQGNSNIGSTVNLSNAQTGNGDSTNIIDRGGSRDPFVIQILTAVGATPTCTYAIQGSNDGSNWFNIPYADSATPTTIAFSTFTITGAGTAFKLIGRDVPVRYVKVVYSANTNVTNTVNAYL